MGARIQGKFYAHFLGKQGAEVWVVQKWEPIFSEKTLGKMNK